MARNALVAGDNGSKLTLTCKDNDTDLAIDLTGKSLTLKFKINDGTLSSRTMTILDPANGKGQYQFAGAELLAGKMEFWAVIQEGFGDQITQLQSGQLRVAKAPA